MKTTLSTFATAALLIFSTAVANAQTDVFTDDFDAAPTNGATRVFAPDNSANGGTFPNSPFDVFGIVDRNVNFSFGDDSLSIFPADTFGVIPEGKTDLFLGFQDTANGDNPDPDGNVSVTWTASAAGMTDLSLSFEIAAMGDFEAADLLEVTASFDGGAAETLFSSAADEEVTATYTLEGGATVDVDDPFAIDGQIILNEFQTLSFPISGAGSNLTLTLSYAGNGGSEVVAIDNLSVTAGGGVITLKGDSDLSGIIDFADIPAFIDALLSGVFQAESDCDCSGMVDFSDIPAFIDILLAQ